MGRGLLVFKGEDSKKKKKKSKHSKKDKGAEGPVAGNNQNEAHPSSSTSSDVARLPQLSVPAAKQQPPTAPKIISCTGEITTSGTVVTGHGTKFEREISAGDALIVTLNGQQQEMRVVTMRLSNISLNLSSPFSENIKMPTKFSVIRKPRDEAKQRRLEERKEQMSKKQEEHKASGNSTEELQYREKTEHGSYRIKRVKVEGQGVTRADLLDMRAKKTSDKYC